MEKNNTIRLLFWTLLSYYTSKFGVPQSSDLVPIMYLSSGLTTSDTTTCTFLNKTNIRTVHKYQRSNNYVCKLTRSSRKSTKRWKIESKSQHITFLINVRRYTLIIQIYHHFPVSSVYEST